jgi:hypothetical protein
MLSKQYGPEDELRCQWNAYGSPKYIYTDGGKDFKFLTYLGDQLGFEFELRQRPSQGGIVERPFRTMRLRLLDNILRDAAVRLLEDKLREIDQAVLQALKTDEKVLDFNVKKILRETKIDKQLLESMRGEYWRGQSA